MLQSRAVPVIAVALAIVATGVAVLLQRHESDSRASQLDLQAVKLELSKLQAAPFSASPATGGSPQLARGLMATGRREIALRLDRLGEGSGAAAALPGEDAAPPVLDGLEVLMRENGSKLDRIYELGATGVGYGMEADRLAGEAGASEARIDGLLDEAGRDYEQRAEHAAQRATLGGFGSTLLLLGAFGFYYRRSRRAAGVNRRLLAKTREESLTDALTGLNNRRALIDDLEARVSESADPGVGPGEAPAGDKLMLTLFDLDGFKQYNDTFGHPAGDVLLRRLGQRLAAAVEGRATAYRMGGDEFCLLAVGGPDAVGEVAELGVVALSDRGKGFEIGCSYGSALIPSEAVDSEAALTLADERMYEQKAELASASRQSSDVLLRVLTEKSAALGDHLSGVGALADLTARRMKLSDATSRRIKTAAELHDVGKTGIPDAILEKPGPLDEDETTFMRSHTLIGERILRAAPSLASAAGLVRSHHERMDGSGYPDGLRGKAIPLGARIIFACDAFDAMISDRSYRNAIPVREAVAELRRCAGTQFDPSVVEAIAAEVEGGAPRQPSPQPVPA